MNPTVHSLGRKDSELIYREQIIILGREGRRIIFICGQVDKAGRIIEVLSKMEQIR